MGFMKFFINIKLLFFIGLFLNNSFCSNVEGDGIVRSVSPRPTIFKKAPPSEQSFAEFSLQNRRPGGQRAGWNADRDEEWTVTKDVLTAHLNPTQEAEIKEFIQKAGDPKALKERKDLLKTLVLGPVERSATPSSEKTRLQSKAIILRFTSPEDRLSLIRALQKKSKAAATQSLQQAQDLLNQNTNAEDRAFIAHSFVSFEDPLQGEEFSEDLKEFRKSKRLSGRMIFHAAQAWQSDRIELLRSWQGLVSFEELRQAKDRVVENFLRLPSKTRKAFLSLLPNGLSPSRHKVRGVHKILEADDDLEIKIQKIENLADLQKKAPTKYDRLILILDKEAPLAASSDEASSSEDEGSDNFRGSVRKRFVKRYIPYTPDESEESGQYSESGEE